MSISTKFPHFVTQQNYNPTTQFDFISPKSVLGHPTIHSSTPCANEIIKSAAVTCRNTFEQTLRSSLDAVVLLCARAAMAVARQDSVRLCLGSVEEELLDAHRHISLTTTFMSHSCISCSPAASADFSRLKSKIVPMTYTV